jgi:hypothetical protein
MCSVPSHFCNRREKESVNVGAKVVDADHD